ncbi:hypothetical protein L9F63_014427, partial [Diploptera punctata]
FGVQVPIILPLPIDNLASSCSIKRKSVSYELIKIKRFEDNVLAPGTTIYRYKHLEGELKKYFITRLAELVIHFSPLIYNVYSSVLNIFFMNWIVFDRLRSMGTSMKLLFQLYEDTVEIFRG